MGAGRLSVHLGGPPIRPVPPIPPVPAAGGRRRVLVTIALAVALVNGAAGVIGHGGWPGGGSGHPRPAGQDSAGHDSAGHDSAGQGIVAAVAPAAGLSGRVVPRGNGRPSPVPVGLDGCDYNYVAADTGRRICVPRTPPPGRRLDCAYLREQGIGSVRVTGQDTRRLAGAAPAAARGTVLCAP
ncbi:hypothetical protein FF36_01615 [Frankia torreyi]|uniref:Uncharacterized protein n=1 Tax=Frankia torreyi TaxID=1856 RepID=A0A0D8BI50_9ACTN|nr:hypothetical protein FF36_01615 [Frankia torreyi]KQC38790.1 hypothetical protein UK82_08370 [Frankia sp. ACN1ag]KQM07431.1 hypothetical protein FF86_1003124 [Frankia sp. CpI1-P]